MKQQDKEFEQYITGHRPLLLKVCRMYARSRADMEDLFQEIIIQLWKSFPRYDGRVQFKTWMYRIALNTAITGIRKAKRTITPLPGFGEALYNIGDEMHTGDEEKTLLLYTAIEKLNDVEKAIIMLYMEDRSYEEMEIILGINQGNIRVKMNRIKEKLRNQKY